MEETIDQRDRRLYQEEEGLRLARMSAQLHDTAELRVDLPLATCGDVAGHEFHGNQYGGGMGGHEAARDHHMRQAAIAKAGSLEQAAHLKAAELHGGVIRGEVSPKEAYDASDKANRRVENKQSDGVNVKSASNYVNKTTSDLVAAYNEVGRVAKYHPKQNTVSLDGRTRPLKEARETMIRVLSERKTKT